MIDWRERWPHFSPEEVLSPDGLKALIRHDLVLIQPHALDSLENFRKALSRSVWVNIGSHERRGFRSCWENQVVGGSANSFHTQGLAFDVTIPGMNPEEVFEKAIEFGWKGVGLYKTFVHIDLRNRLDGETVSWKNI